MKTLFASLIVSAAVAFAGEEPPLDKDSLGLIRVVEDKDGAVNVRTQASAAGKIAGKVKSGCAVSVHEEKDGWALVADDSGAGRDLYIHGSRLKRVTDWKQTAAVVAEKEKSATVKAGPLEVTAAAVPFEEAKHKITREKKGEDEGADLKIDGHTVWGTDGGIPDRALRLTVTLNGKPVALPAEATHDLYQPNLSRAEDLVVLTPGEAAKAALVVMWGSDGAGGYLAVWSLVDGKYAGRTVFAGF